jgi:hypothetical protein
VHPDAGLKLLDLKTRVAGRRMAVIALAADRQQTEE